MKDKNQMTTSIDTEKAFDKINTIYDKNTQQSGSRGSIPQHNKGHILETYGQCFTQWAKTKSFPTKIRNKKDKASLTTPIQHSTGSPSPSNQTSTRNKRHPN